MINEINSTWQQLIGPNKQAGTRLRIFPDGERNLFLSLKSINPDVKSFYMEVSQVSTEGLDILTETEGFQAGIYKQNDGLSRVEISLSDTEYEDLFDVLIDNICEVVNTKTEENESVLAFLNQIILWQKFIQNKPRKTLSDSNKIGLVGELLTLRDLMIPAAGTKEAIKSWTGPSKNASSVRDFEYSGIGIEVKTTTAKKPHSFRVSSEKQLDDKNLEVLLISHYYIDTEVTSEESISLYELVQDIKNSIEDGSIR